MGLKGSPLFLGIDTGGTFTDSVLIDAAGGSKTKVVARSKAPTTHRDLISGIRKSLSGLGDCDFGRVKMVGLSTTLATNAIVEGTGRPVALIVVGYDKGIKLSVGGIGTIITKRLKGGHDVKGKVAEPLDEKEAMRFVRSVHKDVEAFACASYFSVRNPEHENRVKKIISSITEKPVVLGHMLSMDLNADIRATTAALNAGLIPLISELMDSVKGAVLEMGIFAPLMAVKGDGSLMSESTARKRPIETILSGPAASVVGAGALVPRERLKDSVIIDIGGTTSDIAVMGDGRPRLSDSGARVGKFRTFVSAVDVRTVGLGGDSFIYYGDLSEAVTLGPGRILPIGRLAEQYPVVFGMLDSMTEADIQAARKIRYMPTDFFAAGVMPKGRDLDRDVVEMYEELKQSPISPLSGSEFGVGRKRFRVERVLERMIRMGAAVRAGLTPTDVFNADGRSEIGIVEASRLALSVAAGAAGISADGLAERVMDAIRERIVLEILFAAVDGDKRGEGGIINFNEFGVLSGAVRRWLSGAENGDPVSVDINLGREIIAVGAPAGIFIGPSAGRLGVKYSVPEEAGVANAVGAVSGVVMSTMKASIRSDDLEGYIVFMPEERRAFKKLSDAREHAFGALKSAVTDEVVESGGVDVEVKEEWRDINIESGGANILVESVLTVSAVGRPNIGRLD
ncbi:MAG: hydantoinase/oxoprolinase family protein [Deltaproteobacteria bacterium]|uniref:Hydantoinase/oxoprolinase family protein n=1 Tax=Candidatus Zymogenus saltonus TaxID=2844893 RepID=A0A9D8PS66_9DELT|nr:hydantoinase/oxoprolinase family protein [Candidatus Zymogenus saltonus]